ncbi:hypothetical protein [Lysinibacillus capsici]|uniref:hypothetical protein n=1 Tax=Lysinibacillus capsici TaxID=2115968 RepID=UPI000E20AB0E|nr:hypothetical protein [Lysinibacillus capsici]RDV26278.1 hypothetical protein C7B89_22030 [Lysinibacillus capsici]
MTIVKTIDWNSLNGKALKLYVTEPNAVVIGVDEETGRSYVLHEEPLQSSLTVNMQNARKGFWRR